MQLSAFADCLCKRLLDDSPGACALWKLGYSLLFIVFVCFGDWKKLKLFVACFDRNVGDVREPQVSWIVLMHSKECFLGNVVPSFIQEMQRKDQNK